MAPPPRSESSRIDVAIEFLLTALLLIFLPAAMGAVDPWSELTAICVGTAIAVLLAVRSVVAAAAVAANGYFGSSLRLFVFLALVQLISFPAGVVKTISPRLTRCEASCWRIFPMQLSACHSRSTHRQHFMTSGTFCWRWRSSRRC